uniref:Uncharacterized protein n=1 Tax=Anopheles christyi TaxID=43041 RepID=A0A182KIG0_9DIPT
MRWWFRCQLYLRGCSFMSLRTENGPFSVNSPYRDDAPGPPCSHRTTGASWSSLAAKYQKNRFELMKGVRKRGSPTSSCGACGIALNRGYGFMKDRFASIALMSNNPSRSKAQETNNM